MLLRYTLLVWCLPQVDLNVFQPEALMAEPVFADQVHLSNILLGSKPDLATQQQQEGFQAFAEQLFPPKQQVQQNGL
jgi:G3E family GTPase